MLFFRHYTMTRCRFYVHAERDEFATLFVAIFYGARRVLLSFDLCLTPLPPADAG